MNTWHESFLSRDGSPRELKFTCFGWNHLNKISTSKTTKTQLTNKVSHTDRKDHYGSKIYIKQPRCLSWNKGYYITKALLQTN